MVFPVAGAILGGAAIGGLSSLLAGNEQADAANQAAGVSQRQYDTTRADMAPWRDAGKLSLSRLMDLMGLSPEPASLPGANVAGQTPDQIRQSLISDYQRQVPGGMPTQAALEEALNKNLSAQQAYNSSVASRGASTAPGGDYGMLMKQFTGQDLQNEPGYQFGLSEGEKGINRATAARGGYDSGATLKALTRFNEDYAGTKYDAAFNRDQIYKNQVYNQLAGISGTGQTSTQATGALGANAANQMGQAYQNAGDARAAGIMGVGNAVNQGMGNYLNYTQSQSWLDALKKPSNSGGVTGV